jgi:hypothetical protein
MGLHEIKKLLQCKGNGHQTEVATHIMGDLCQHTSEKRLITRICRELKKLNNQSINAPMRKLTNELNRTFPREEVQMGKKTCEEILNIPGKGNANQDHIKILPHSC